METTTSHGPTALIDAMLGFLLPNAREPAAPPTAAPAPAADLPPHLAYAGVRTMVAAALCDGRLAAEERRAVERRLAAAELTAEQVARVHKDLVLPANPDELAALALGAADREALFRLAGVMLCTDGRVRDSERTWLDHLGAAFGIAPRRRLELADLDGLG